MTNLNSLVTRMVARAFNAFVQDRLKAELSDPEVILMLDSTDAAVEKKLAPKRERQLRESQAPRVTGQNARVRICRRSKPFNLATSHARSSLGS
jgi:hypothetical protein